MPTITITFNPVTQQVYVDPPLPMLTKDDPSILFKLVGHGVFNWNRPDGSQAPITLVNAIDAGHGYSNWPSGASWQEIDGSWLLTFNEAFGGTTQTYYRWMFHLVNNDRTWFIDDDPDIGNDPPSG
jgi:hypothetical protein